MPFVHVQKAPAAVLQKLSNLFYSLQNVKQHFEEAANSVKDNLMRMTLRGVAQESSQYANELSCKIQTMGGDPEAYLLRRDSKLATNRPPVVDADAYDDDIMKQCAANEAEMIKLIGIYLTIPTYITICAA